MKSYKLDELDEQSRLVQEMFKDEMRVDFSKFGFEPTCKEHWPMDLGRDWYDHFCVDKDFLDVYKTKDTNANS